MKKSRFKTKEKILVTGATGFVGANLTRRLIAEGFEVHIITRKTSDKWRVASILHKLTNHVVDLLEENKLKKIIMQVKPEVIFHLATLGVYGGTSTSEKNLIETNLLGTINLIEACEKVKYRCFVNTGSSSEYGPKTSPMKETDICAPINIYGVTKCAATHYVSLIAKTKANPIITFRLFSPFGPYDDRSRFMTYAIVRALQNKKLNFANPNAVRDYIYVEDVLNLFMSSIDKAEKNRGEIFNVGSGSQTKISYIADKIIEFSNSRSLINWNSVPPRFFDTGKWEANISKTCKYFNWRPQYSIDNSLKRTIAWFKENLFLYSKYGI